MTQSIDNVINDVSNFVESEFSLKPIKSKLKMYSDKDWKEFCKVNGFDENRNGLYVPKTLSAYVNYDCEQLLPNIVHEYHCHGVFCENSILGRQLIEANDLNKFLYGFVDFKKQVFGLCNRNIENYEGFALWLESKIIEGLGLSWKKREETSNTFYIQLYNFFIKKEKEMSKEGIMKRMGFAQYIRTSPDNSIA